MHIIFLFQLGAKVVLEQCLDSVLISISLVGVLLCTFANMTDWNMA